MTRVAVLMYHRLGAGVIAGREAGEQLYAVTPPRFEEQLQAVEATGSPVLGFDELLAATGGAGQSRRGVAITFDDGNESDHSAALPALRRRGWPAIFFVVPAWLGRSGYLDWTQAREIQECRGMTVGAHGFDHTWLSSLDDEGIRRQLREASRALESGLGRRPRALSLPGGWGGARAVRIAQELGFELVATSLPRLAQPGRGLAPTPRFAVRRADGPGFVRDLAEQRLGTLLRCRLRHDGLSLLRRCLGTWLYQRLRSRAGA